MNWYKAFTNKALPYYLFWAVYFLGLLYLAMQLNVSVDETFTLNTTSYPFKKVITQSYHFEGQPPLYFLLVAVWRTAADSVFFIRLFSVSAIAGAVWYFYKTVWLLTARKKISVATTVLFAVNPFTIWAAAEMRPFALVIFFAAVSLYLFYRFCSTNKKKYLRLFTAIGIAGVFTQYLFVFYLAALGMALFFFKGWQNFKQYMLYMLAVAAIFFISLFFAGNQVQLAVTASFNISPLQRITAVLHSPQNLLLCAAQLPFSRVLRLLIIILFAGAVLWALYKWYKKTNAAGGVFFLHIKIAIAAVCLTVLFTAAFFTVLKIDYYDKYLAVAFPLFCLVFCLFSVYNAAVKYTVFTIAAVLYGYVAFLTYRQPVKAYDNKQLAAYITSIEKTDEPLFFYQHVLSKPFSYSYSGKNNVYTLPDSLRFDSSYLKKIDDTVKLQQQFIKFISGQSFILINDRHEAAFNQAPDVLLLEDFLKKNFIAKLDTLFSGRNPQFVLRVRRLQKKE